MEEVRAVRSAGQVLLSSLAGHASFLLQESTLRNKKSKLRMLDTSSEVVARLHVSCKGALAVWATAKPSCVVSEQHENVTLETRSRIR